MRRMANESRRSQLLRGVLDLCLLAVMDDGPAYGYEMTKRLRARGLSIVGEGSIYPLLGDWSATAWSRRTGPPATEGLRGSTTAPHARAGRRSRSACPSGGPPATPWTRCSPPSRSGWPHERVRRTVPARVETPRGARPDRRRDGG